MAFRIEQKLNERAIDRLCDKFIQAKTNDRRVRRFGDILAPL